MKKPLEFVIYKSDGSNFLIKFYYDDKTAEEIVIQEKPNDIKLNKHYAITDTYGYSIVDDRKGL